MSLRLGDIAPNFQAQTTAGTVDFYEYPGDGWGILFSHPGEDVIVVPDVSTEDALQRFPKGVNIVKPYLRYTPQPNLT